MTHESSQQGELVAVEAGMVADTETGKLHSVWLESHRAMLEESLNEKQALLRRKARIIKALCWFVLVALPVGWILFLATSERGRQIAGELWSSLGNL